MASWKSVSENSKLTSCKPVLVFLPTSSTCKISDVLSILNFASLKTVPLAVPLPLILYFVYYIHGLLFLPGCGFVLQIALLFCISILIWQPMELFSLVAGSSWPDHYFNTFTCYFIDCLNCLQSLPICLLASAPFVLCVCVWLCLWILFLYVSMTLRFAKRVPQ